MLSTDSKQIWTRKKAADGFYTFSIRDDDSTKFLTAKGKHSLIVKGKMYLMSKFHLSSQLIKSFTDLSKDERNECQDEVKGHKITCYFTLVLLSALLVVEFLQFFSKCREGEPLEYFGMQNITEFIMFGLTIALFVVQWRDDEMKFKSKYSEESCDEEKTKSNHYAQKHLLGWILFLAWMDLTIFLGKI